MTNVYGTCCSSVCGGPCTTLISERLKQQELDFDELYAFYRPYDPLCPDRKRDGECLEIHPNPSGRENKGPESTTHIAEGIFDLINWIRDTDN
mgnify:CR=1 FL=1